MSDIGIADDKKKDPPKVPATKDGFTERVTVRTRSGDKFLNPKSDVPAFSTEIGGKRVIHVVEVTGADPRPKSEIIDKDGKVWVVTVSKRVTGNFAKWLCYVEEKPAEKKP